MSTACHDMLQTGRRLQQEKTLILVLASHVHLLKAEYSVCLTWNPVVRCLIMHTILITGQSCAVTAGG